MTAGLAILWLTLAVLGVIVCGLFAGLETGFYSLNRVRLHVLAEQGSPAARRIAILAARPGRTLATLLVGTNVATNIATSATGLLLEGGGLTEWQIIAADVLIVTPILFIFAETVPKDLFAAYADKLVYVFSGLLLWTHRLMTAVGIVPLITGVSRLVMHLLGSHMDLPVATFHPRHHVQNLVREGIRPGLLSAEQSAIVWRVFSLGGRCVADEMIPWPSVLTVRADDPPAVLWKLADQTSRSRFPVVDAGGQVLGVVSLYEALLHDREQCPPITTLMRPAPTLRADQRLREALRYVQQQHVALAVVVDEHDKPVGIVTVKDLVEPITGELASW